MKLVHGLRFDNIRGDIYGGVTAAVVALPLALAFGVASGAGPMAGLYGAIIIGFFAALFGGTPTQISGPTGPMTVVMAAIVTRYAHDPALAFTVVMMGGALQIAFGALRLGNLITLVPFTVISGFMSGIGVIIIILQFAPLLGQPTPAGGTIGVIRAVPDVLAGIQWTAAAVGFGALAVMLFTPKALARLVPPPLIALVLGTAAVWLFLPGVPVLGDIPTGLPDLRWPSFTLAQLPDMVLSALVLALLGSIDSLLTSLIADNITRTHHDSDRELVGQGIGNVLAGLFGAIPGAGATMRTVVNVRSGGGTPISGMLHALVLLAVVVGLGPLAGHIPHAVLAGILVKVGIDIIDWAFLHRVPRAPKAGVILMFVVLGLTVFVDLIVAVAAGVIGASLLFVKRMSDLQLANIRAAHEKDDLDGVPLTEDEESLLARHTDDVMFYHLSGPVSFGAAQGMTRRVVAKAAYKVLVLDLTDVTFVDTSAALALNDIIVNAKDLGLEVFLIGMGPHVESMLTSVGYGGQIPTDHVYDKRLDALHHVARAVRQLEGEEPSHG